MKVNANLNFFWFEHFLPKFLSQIQYLFLLQNFYSLSFSGVFSLVYSNYSYKFHLVIARITHLTLFSPLQNSFFLRKLSLISLEPNYMIVLLDHHFHQTQFFALFNIRSQINNQFLRSIQWCLNINFIKKVINQRSFNT